MSKNARFYNKDGMNSNRELRTNFGRGIKAEAFGIYRPLTQDSMEKIQKGLVSAKRITEEFLERERDSPSSEIRINQDLGVTFVENKKVKEAIRKGLLHHGFNLEALQEGVEAYNEDLDDLEIPIEKLDWFPRYPNNGRKLAGLFELGESTVELVDITADVGDIMVHARGEQLKVGQPTHTSFLQYDKNGDNLDLSRVHKKDLAELVHREFQSQGIGSVVVGNIVVGSSYSVPMLVAA